MTGSDSAERTIVVVMAIDDAYADPLIVTLYSAARRLSAGWSLDVTVVEEDVSVESKQRIEARLSQLPVRISWRTLDLSGVVGHWPGIEKPGSVTVYHRLYIGKLLDDSIERALFLDADLLVLGDLAELWKTPLDGHVVGAVPDAYASTLHVPRLAEIDFGSDESVATEGRRLDGPYFNAGVQLIDLRAWRETNVRARAEELLWSLGDQLFMRDQDALNLVLAEEWKRISPAWNYHELPHMLSTWDVPGASDEELAETFHAPAIIHYVGRKPWEDRCAHRYADAWRTEARQAGLVDVPGGRGGLMHRMFRQPHAALHWLRWRGTAERREGRPQRALSDGSGPRSCAGVVLRNPWTVVTYPLWALVMGARSAWMIRRTPRRGPQIPLQPSSQRRPPRPRGHRYSHPPQSHHRGGAVSRWVKATLTRAFWFATQTAPRYRGPVRSILRAVGLEGLALRSQPIRRLLLTKDEPRYRAVLETPPCPVQAGADVGLHVLTSENDLLRGVWALKSFYRSSGIRAGLTIHNDGSLTTDSLAMLRHHFPGCRISDGERAAEAVAAFPMCHAYRHRHVLARKLFDVLVEARSEYVLVMDTDILWFAESETIRNCAHSRTPFYMQAFHDAYARNSDFLRTHCDLHPAPRVNTGMIGFPRAAFHDFAFIEGALDKMVNVPPALVRESIGFPVPESVKAGRYDPEESLSWWVLEQTLYALLFGRHAESVELPLIERPGVRAHPFVNRPITPGTALQHYILDRKWNAQFPVGVQHLLDTGFLDGVRETGATS